MEISSLILDLRKINTNYFLYSKNDFYICVNNTQIYVKS
jgi:hypothetical protein